QPLPGFLPLLTPKLRLVEDSPAPRKLSLMEFNPFKLFGLSRMPFHHLALLWRSGRQCSSSGTHQCCIYLRSRERLPLRSLKTVSHVPGGDQVNVRSAILPRWCRAGSRSLINALFQGRHPALQVYRDIV
ncbi:hypothetical protein GOODEAATRI_028428, partial [Goodea atripinnis]